MRERERSDLSLLDYSSLPPLQVFDPNYCPPEVSKLEASRGGYIGLRDDKQRDADARVEGGAGGDVVMVAARQHSHTRRRANAMRAR